MGITTIIVFSLAAMSAVVLGGGLLVMKLSFERRQMEDEWH
jgi:hypothetical protein